MNSEVVENVKKSYKKVLENEVILNLEPALEDLENLKKEGKNHPLEYKEILKSINTSNHRIRVLQSALDNIREPKEIDMMERIDIRNSFAEEVSKVMPDDVPVLFHGSKMIGIVEDIIRSGGLLSPKDRHMEYLSFTTGIDVTTKNDISTTLEFADTSEPFVFPYGAIFAFYAAEEDYDRVLSNKGSLLAGAVHFVSFREEPERLLAIITTSENIERLKKVATESGIDENKIITHQEFLDLCKNKYNGFEKK